MRLEDRIEVMANLGRHFSAGGVALEQAFGKAQESNPWFTRDNIVFAINAISKSYLDPNKLREWTAAYPIEDKSPKTVGIVMAGNLPLVGFHDLLATYLSGHRVQIRYSDKDEVLVRYVVEYLSKKDPRPGIFKLIKKLKDFDAVIATGSDNTARYFDYYFGKYPHIIRKNRHGVGVLDGRISEKDLIDLGEDVSLCEFGCELCRGSSYHSTTYRDCSC